tara:strand:- start:65 stop:406 length:342 start_codon:yes stop_codon:yes gene_type:complete
MTNARTADLEIVIAAIQQHLNSAEVVRLDRGTMRMPLPPIKCRDGAEFSVQAGEHVYCSPRDNTGPWDSVEVLTLSTHTATNWDDSGDVAGWVPIEDVAKEILDRGYLALTAG